MTRDLFQNAHFIDIHHHGPIHHTAHSDVILTIYNIVASKEQKPADDDLFSYGHHPWYASNSAIDREQLESTCSDPNCLFIGECGLDKFKGATAQEQLDLLQIHLEVSLEINKPVILHNVKMTHEFLRLRKKYSSAPPWIFHDYNDGIEMTQQCIKENFYFSLGPTYINKDQAKIQETASNIPLDRILLETDEGNYSIDEIYEKFAKQRSISVQELQRQIRANFNSLIKNCSL
jgi:TatD DNase family protein